MSTYSQSSDEAEYDDPDTQGSQASDRQIATDNVSRIGDHIYQYRNRVWRRALWPKEKFLYEDDHSWATLVDLDQPDDRAKLGDRNKAWVFMGQPLVEPTEHMTAILRLGTEDSEATQDIEWDIGKGEVVENGFRLGSGIGRILWLDADNIVFFTSSDATMLTEVGNPRALRVWARGSEPFHHKPIFTIPESSIRFDFAEPFRLDGSLVLSLTEFINDDDRMANYFLDATAAAEGCIAGNTPVPPKTIHGR
jgi:prolyl oligopeptidase PreP (S9A serine peptidase family)